jgi:hypothetical protein
MKLDTDPFLVSMVELMDKKILLCTDQAEMTKGKNVDISDELCNRMIKPHNPEIGVWKENVLQKLAKRVKPTSSMLIEKYQQLLEEDLRYWVTRGIKWDSFFKAQNRLDQWEPRHTKEPRRRMVHHYMDQEPRIRQNPRFTNESGSSNPDRCVNRPDVLRDGEESSRRPEQTEEHVVMVGLWPCKVSSEVHINERRVSEPIWIDKGKQKVPESEGEKDPKRTHMVLSKGHEVVELGYSRLLGDATKATDRGEESGNPNWVGREYDTD